MLSKQLTPVLVLICLTGVLISFSLAAPEGISRTPILPAVECPDGSTLPEIILDPGQFAAQELQADQYIACLQGKPLVFTCSEGLFFNWTSLSCEFPDSQNNSSNSNEFWPDGDLDLDPIGPIVPISPDQPIPISSQDGTEGQQPLPSNPVITKPNPDVLPPVPVLPAQPLPPFPRPIPGLPAQPLPQFPVPALPLPPFPRPVPYE